MFEFLNRLFLTFSQNIEINQIINDYAAYCSTPYLFYARVAPLYYTHQYLPMRRILLVYVDFTLRSLMTCKIWMNEKNNFITFSLPDLT